MGDVTAVLAELVELGRRVGADKTLVLHGGGNISAKTSQRDHLGRERPVLLIKASGTDLRTIDANGFAGLYLDDLLTLRARAAMSDEEMVAFLSHTLTEASSPRPSIETLLHGFRPERWVCHVHADAICALTNTPRVREHIARALGSVALIEYVRPGFELSKRVADVRGDAVVLAHHGLVTWNDDRATCLARALELEQMARRYLTDQKAARPRAFTAQSPMPDDALEELLLTLRRRLSRSARVTLAVEPHGRPIAERADVERIATAGPATADHLLRTRPWSAVLRDASGVDGAVDAWEADYAAYLARNTARLPRGVRTHEPMPAVFLVPRVGVVARGRDARDARTIAEVAMHTHSVAADAIDAFGEVEPLSETDLFDIDYWPLELAKVRPAPTNDLAGRIVLVTGAASGIGRDAALGLVHAGASVIATDRDAAGLDETGQLLTDAGSSPIALVGDVTDTPFIDRLVHAAVTSFGGLDGIVSNAGIAVTGDLADLSDDDWSRSLAVNATSHFLLTRRALAVFGRQGLGGSMVYVASKNAFSPGAGFGAYSVAKAAEVQLARLAAIEGGRIGVRANVVSPDAVFEGSRLWSDDMRRERARSHGVEEKDLQRFYADRSLLRQPVRPSDVTEAILFLLSDRSSRMTGGVLTVDSGVPAAFPR